MATIRGGAKLHEALNVIVAKAGNAELVKVGFLENAKYPDGTPVAMVAAINEFGAPAHGQPPRPFFRHMIAAKSGEWPKAIADLLKDNDYDAALTLGQTGQAVSGQLRQSIVDLVSPPNAPSTIARKGFDKPLVDIGHMLNSVDYEVQ